MPVANDEPPTVFVSLLSEALDVLADLGLQRRSNHAPCALASELVERDPTLNILPDGEPANI